MYQAVEYQLQNTMTIRKMRKSGQPTRYNPSKSKFNHHSSSHLISLDSGQLCDCVIHDILTNKALGIVSQVNYIMRAEYILFLVIRGKLC